MTREELEKELEAYHWRKQYHGTLCDIWDNGETIVELTNNKLFDGFATVPIENVSVDGKKIVMHREVEL